MSDVASKDQTTPVVLIIPGLTSDSASPVSYIVSCFCLSVCPNVSVICLTIFLVNLIVKNTQVGSYLTARSQGL